MNKGKFYLLFRLISFYQKTVFPTRFAKPFGRKFQLPAITNF